MRADARTTVVTIGYHLGIGNQWESGNSNDANSQPAQFKAVLVECGVTNRAVCRQLAYAFFTSGWNHRFTEPGNGYFGWDCLEECDSNDDVRRCSDRLIDELPMWLFSGSPILPSDKDD